MEYYTFKFDGTLNYVQNIYPARPLYPIFGYGFYEINEDYLNTSIENYLNPAITQKKKVIMVIFKTLLTQVLL